nr:hypothetical protein [Leptospira semungkisensis]
MSWFGHSLIQGMYSFLKRSEKEDIKFFGEGDIEIGADKQCNCLSFNLNSTDGKKGSLSKISKNKKKNALYKENRMNEKDGDLL